MMNMRLNELVREFESIDSVGDPCFFDACYVYRTFGSHRINDAAFFYEGEIKENEAPKIDDYLVWLEFFNDYNGMYSYVYYPKSPKPIKGAIKVIFNGYRIRGYIEWQHGKDGLYRDYIKPLLLLDSVGRANFEGLDKVVVDLVGSYSVFS